MAPGRWWAGLAAVLLLAGAVVGCSGEDDRRRTIGMIRPVAASEREAGFYEGLAAGGYPASRLRVLGRARSEVHTDPADIRRTVRRWTKRGVDVIVATFSGGALAAADAVDVPVVFLSNDPVATGLLADERHPEGRLTGQTYRVPSDRLLQVAADAFGPARRVGCLVVEDDPSALPVLADLRRGAEALGVELHCADVGGPGGVPAAVLSVLSQGIDVIDVIGSPQMVQHYEPVADALVDTNVPDVTTVPLEFAALTLQPDGRAIYTQLGRQVARLLDGADVRDVPVEDPAHFLLTVNERVALRLGRSIPAAVLRRADHVIR
jgi:putative ABC transport system substrate-binding protein